MGLLQQEIEDKRLLAAENGFESGAATITGMFRGGASESPAHGDIVFVEADENNARSDLTAPELRDLALKLAKIKDNDEMMAAAAGLLPSRIISSYFAHLDQRSIQARQDSAKARADAHYMALLQAQIAALDVQIGDLEDALGYLARTEDVEGTMEKQGVQSAIEAWEKRTGRKFDPNGPDAANILKDIIEDDIKAKKQQKAEAEQEAQLLNDEIDHKRELAESNDSELVEKNRSYEGRSETTDQDTREDRKAATKDLIQVTSDIEDLEQRRLALEDLAQYKGTPEYVEKIDEFIENSAAKTLMGLMTDLDGDPDIQIRIGLRNLKAELAEWDEYKGTPDYTTYIEISVSEAPEAVREALKNDPDLDEKVVAALYKPYSDTMDKPDEDDLKSVMVDDEKETEVSVASAQRNPSASSPGLG